MISTFSRLGGVIRRTMREAADGGLEPARGFAAAHATAQLLRAFYDNTLYEDVARWQSYRSRYRLPRGIRPIYNPVRRCVDWYAGHVFRGAWTEDGGPSPSGAPHLLRIPADVRQARPALVAAAIQALDWGNWRTSHKHFLVEGATIGSVLVEVVDDLDRRKVYPVVHPIERVADVRLDAAGNVIAFTLDYPTWDEAARRLVRYRKQVDKQSIVEWRDGVVTSEEPNPYGFVPAVWVKHRDRGGLFGSPAVEGVIPKIDEANRLATSLHNYIAKLQAQPQVIAGGEPPVLLSRQMKAAATLTDDDLARFEELIPWLYTSDSSARSFPLMQPVPLDGALTALTRVLEEIEADLPEIALDRELRAMSQVTGPGAERLVSDVVARLEEAQANYLRGTVAIMQMAVSIGGWRLNRGDWGLGADIDRQQAKFAPFSLESFGRGDEDLMLEPAPLFDPTERERLDALLLRKTALGLPNEALQREYGYTDEQIAAFAEMAEREAARQTVGAF